VVVDGTGLLVVSDTLKLGELLRNKQLRPSQIAQVDDHEEILQEQKQL